MSRTEPLVVAQGAAVALLIATPAAIANVVLASGDHVNEAGLAVSWIFVLLGFVAGGAFAGANAAQESSRHGAMAGVAAFVPIEAIAILGRLDRGDPVRVGGIIVIGLLAACAGTVGAQLGANRRARKERA